MACFDGSEDVSQQRLWAGNHIRLGVHRRRFRTLISARASFTAHSGMLEAVASNLAFKWFLRAPSRHWRRVVMLVDAKSVLGALVKGRSFAPTLRHGIRQTALLSLAGGLHMKYVYIASEQNPADAPSRDAIRRKHKKKQCSCVTYCTHGH